MLFLISFLNLALCHVSIGSRNHFIDENGATLIFHGFNVVYKQHPYIPRTEGFHYMETFSEEDCKILQSMGFNIIRLHVSFEGAMPKRGEIDYDYLAKIREIVRMAAKYDIFVLLDAHQDLFNRQFCGNGFPDWAVNRTDFPSPSNIQLNYEQGYPKLKDCYQQKFVLYYTTNDVGRHFESLYNNENGLADLFGQFWQEVAEYHKNEQNVIGYEIINEPSAGNFQSGILDYVWPGYANKRYLMPFYKRIHNYIRKADTNKIIFFEADYLDVLGASFGENIGGPEYVTREAFSYHVYCGIERLSSWFCNKINDLLYWLKIGNVRELKIGGMLTEFGAVGDDQQSKSILDTVLNTADYYQQSWTYWQYKGYYDHTTMSTMDEEGIFYEDGSFQKVKLSALVRPFAYQICGSVIEANQFDSEKKEFHLKYESKDGCQTRVYIPTEYHYNNGFDHVCNCSLQLIKQNHYEIVGQGSVDLLIYG